MGATMDDFDPRCVGPRIVAVRKAHGLSQSELAAECGFTVTALSNWENGRQRPHIKHAKIIIDRFNLTLDYLFLGRIETLRGWVVTEMGLDE